MPLKPFIPVHGVERMKILGLHLVMYVPSLFFSSWLRVSKPATMSKLRPSAITPAHQQCACGSSSSA